MQSANLSSMAIAFSVHNQTSGIFTVLLMETATGMGQSQIPIIILYLVGTMLYSIPQISALHCLSSLLMYAIKYTITQAAWNLGLFMKISTLLSPPILVAFLSSMVQEALSSYCTTVR